MNLIQYPNKDDNKFSQVLNYSRNNLLAFAKFMRPEMLVAEHHRIMSAFIHRLIENDHPQKLNKGSLSMPVRHGKSYIVSEALPAFLIGNVPDSQLIVASWGNPLSSDFAETVNRMVRDDRFKLLFPEVRPIGDSLYNMNWRNTNRSKVKFTSVQSGISGFGAGCNHYNSKFRTGFICDDLIENKKAAMSEKIIRNLHKWLLNDAITRLLPNSFFFIMGTRWTALDAQGFMERLEPGEWTGLNMEALCEDVLNDPLGRELGEPLWGSYITKEYLEGRKSSMDETDWNSLYQGHPTVVSGAIFKREVLIKSKVPYDMDKSKSSILVIRTDTEKNPGTNENVFMQWDLENNRITLRKIWRNRDKLFEIYDFLKAYLANNKIKYLILDGPLEHLERTLVTSKEISKRPKIVTNKIKYKAISIGEVAVSYMEQGRIRMQPDVYEDLETELLAFPAGVDTELVHAYLSGIDVMIGNRRIILKENGSIALRQRNQKFRKHKEERPMFGVVNAQNPPNQ